MEWDNYRKIQYFGGPLAANYTWGNPFQATSDGDQISSHGVAGVVLH